MRKSLLANAPALPEGFQAKPKPQTAAHEEDQGEDQHRLLDGSEQTEQKILASHLLFTRRTQGLEAILERAELNICQLTAR
jgi:hypothetical protein